jgi:hypothetical protein
MAFVREEENGIRGGGLTCATWWGEVGGGGSDAVSSDCSRPTVTQARRP